jgi:hypothetical protein
MLRKPQVVRLIGPKPYHSGGARWLGFAARIRANYGIVCARMGGLELRWFRRHFRAATFLSRWLMFARFPRYQVQVSPQLHFRQDSHTQVHYAEPKHAVALRAGMQRFVRNHYSLALRSVRLLESKSVHTSVRALVRENRGVERYFAAQPLPSVAPSRIPAPPPPATKVLTIAKHEEADKKVLPDGFFRPAVSVSAVLPEMDVNRIADQVLRQMDHRIAAWRERRGRG